MLNKDVGAQFHPGKAEESKLRRRDMPRLCANFVCGGWKYGATGRTIWLWVKTGSILVYFSGDWDVHWGYGLLTHGHIGATVHAIFMLSSHRSCRRVKECRHEISDGRRVHKEAVTCLKDPETHTGGAGFPRLQCLF